MFPHQFCNYLSIIKQLVSQIRKLQLENGFSMLEINTYLQKIVTQYIKAHTQANNLDQYICLSVFKLTPKVEKIIGGLVRLLQVQKSNLQDNIYSQFISPNEVQKIQDIDCPQSKTNLSRIKIPADDNPEQFSLFIKTPEYKLNRDRIWFSGQDQLIQSNKQFDKIEKSIEQTLQRTRKLRSYLNEKLVQQKLRKLNLRQNTQLSNQDYDFGGEDLEWM